MQLWSNSKRRLLHIVQDLNGSKDSRPQRWGKNKNYIFGLFYCYHLELVLAWFPAGKKISAVQHLKARSRVLRPYDNMTASEKKKTFYSSRVQQRNLTKFSTWDCRQLACSGCLQRCSDFLERRCCDGNPINILLRGANLKSQFVKTEAPPRNPSWRVKDKMTASGDSHDQRTTIFTIAVPMRKLYERRATVKLHYPLCLTCHFPHTGLFEWRELKTCHLKKKNLAGIFLVRMRKNQSQHQEMSSDSSLGVRRWVRWCLKMKADREIIYLVSTTPRAHQDIAPKIQEV